jgi:molecular chaperone GrpE
LRAQADYQNLRRRQLGDIEAAVRRAQTPLLENVLLVLDYLEMALAMECKHDESKNLAAGVRLTRDQLLQTLEREEVRAISAGGNFDPSLHEAVGTVETETHAAGTIVGLVRSGWTYRGQVLRPAHVRVATTPAKSTQAQEASE